MRSRSERLDLSLRARRAWQSSALKCSLWIASLSLAMTISVVGFAIDFGRVAISRDTKQIAIFNVEVARTQTERETGLMYRKSLMENSGMWFVFDKDETVPFWMENTYISLDIIFVDKNGKVINVAESTKPMSRAPIYSAGKYRYVLEVPAGISKKIPLRSGDIISFQAP